MARGPLATPHALTLALLAGWMYSGRCTLGPAPCPMPMPMSMPMATHMHPCKCLPTVPLPGRLFRLRRACGVRDISTLCSRFQSCPRSPDYSCLWSAYRCCSTICSALASPQTHSRRPALAHAAQFILTSAELSLDSVHRSLSSTRTSHRAACAFGPPLDSSILPLPLSLSLSLSLARAPSQPLQSSPGSLSVCLAARRAARAPPPPPPPPLHPQLQQPPSPPPARSPPSLSLRLVSVLRLALKEQHRSSSKHPPTSIPKLRLAV
ncbi:uncharacterized protein J3D65DRAFT_605787 [Phyllosticta citribraziliensis]|uniref:Uncharacterized protein n=1 Tax=Phyllosticta citribraziliensis TaxID=989973 RepID=A0ABR1LDF2_9PEZI